MMFTTAQTPTASFANIWPKPGQVSTLPERFMLLLVIVALFAVAVCVIISGVRMPRSVTPTKLGWMSEQWLAEYRASHAS